MILCSNPKAQVETHKGQINQAMQRVLEGGRYILGPETHAFEAEFAAYVGVSQAVGVGSGTEALHCALKACGVGPGDEVITVSHTAVATVAAIELAGATPVLVDIEPDYFTMDPAKLRSALSSHTRAIIPVHLYGQAADLGPILEFARQEGLRVIEDCAQAPGGTYQGKRVGAQGDLGCFSFYPTKNLGALGDAGMVVTDDPGMADRVRQLREYGWKDRYISATPGLNSRLDEFQAAILRVKLPHLDAENEQRARLAEAYDHALSGLDVSLPKQRPGGRHVFHLYVVRSSHRDALQAWLKERSVGALVHYPVPVHLQPAYRERLRCGDNLSQTERAANQVLSLPMYPELSHSDQQAVIRVMASFKP